MSKFIKTTLVLFFSITLLVGCDNTSEDSSGENSIAQVVQPVIDPGTDFYLSEQDVTITCETEGADIYYTLDGSEPSESSILYNPGEVLNIQNTTIIKARAYLFDMLPSEIAENTIIIDPIEQVDKPIILPETGTYNSVQYLALYHTDDSAQIYYTLNGTEPTESSTLYNPSIDVLIDSTTTIKARAYITDMLPSETGIKVVTIDFPDVAIPEFDISPGLYGEEQTVTITCETSGASIYYTTNGSFPNEGSTEYTGPITVTSTTTIRARAFMDNMDPSGLALSKYTIINGMVAYYPFNGDADDESGNGNHGTNNGATLTSDRSGNPNSAYSFDGIDDYIELSNESNFDLQSFTISAFIKPDDLPVPAPQPYATADFYIVSKGPIFGNYVLALSKQTGGAYPPYGHISYHHQTSSGNFFMRSFNNKIYTSQYNGGFYHVVVTYDSSVSVDNVKIYVNGQFDYDASSSWLPALNNSKVLIGKREDTSTENFNGIIDDVAIFNRPLSAAEIQALYIAQ